MTREEAIKVLNGKTRTKIVNELETREWFKFREALEMAIQALSVNPQYTGNEFFNFDAPMVKKSMEQDVISREDALIGVDAMYNNSWDLRDFKQNVDLMLNDLPPVPQKTGHWIWSDEIGRYVCDKCGKSDGKDKEMVKSGEYPLSNYCNNCGARMVEPQESEDKA